MPDKASDAGARASAESIAITAASKASCEGTRAQIQWSRGAIARSLDLLRRSYFRLHD